MNDLLRSLARERESRATKSTATTSAAPTALQTVPRASARSAEMITDGEGVYRDLLTLIVEPMRLEQRNTFASVCRAWRVAARTVYTQGKFASTMPLLVAALPNDEVAVANHGSVRIYGHDGAHRRSICDEPTATITGMAFDTINRRLFLAMRLGSVNRYRMPSGVLDGCISDFNVLRCPEALCLWQNVLFVADSTAHRIATFDADSGALLRHLGKEGELLQPRAVAAQRNRVYVIDSVKDHIVIFCWLTGEKLTAIGTRGRAPGEFTNLRGLAVVRHYLLVIEEHRLQLLTLSGVPCQVLVVGLLHNSQLRGACVSSERNAVMVGDVGQGCVHLLAFGDAIQ